MNRSKQLLRLVVGAVLLAAGIGKLVAGESARLAPILLGDVSGPVVVASEVTEAALPWLEALAGVATWLAAGRVARTMLAMLIAGLVTTVAFALPAGVRCGCFGVFGGLEGRALHVIVALGFLASTVALGVLERRSREARGP